MQINDMLRKLVENGASDLHLKVPSPPMLRINGALRPVPEAPALTPPDLEEIFRTVSTEAQRAVFQRELELDMAYSVPGLARFRVNVFQQRGTLGLAIRVVPLTVFTLDQLGLPEVCRSLATKPRGLILVTGPTGSGKSTTLAAMVDYMNEHQELHIITIEDPIEFLHRDKKSVIAQRELGQDTHSFSAALRHVLRQDPDVIMVGEMRDLETIATALTAAETGHLVLGTLHTTSAPQTIDRIIDVFPPHQQTQIRLQLSLVLEGVLCQTLVPKAQGRGRVAAVEVMAGTSAVKNLIREGKTHQIPSVMQMGGQFGMQTLDQALRNLVQQGQITLEEALQRANNPEEIRRMSRPF